MSWKKGRGKHSIKSKQVAVAASILLGNKPYTNFILRSVLIALGQEALSSQVRAIRMTTG